MEFRIRKVESRKKRVTWWRKQQMELATNNLTCRSRYVAASPAYQLAGYSTGPPMLAHSALIAWREEKEAKSINSQGLCSQSITVIVCRSLSPWYMITSVNSFVPNRKLWYYCLPFQRVQSSNASSFLYPETIGSFRRQLLPIYKKTWNRRSKGWGYKVQT